MFSDGSFYYNVFLNWQAIDSVLDWLLLVFKIYFLCGPVLLERTFVKVAIRHRFSGHVLLNVTSVGRSSVKIAIRHRFSSHV